MSSLPPLLKTDRECLAAFARRPDVAALHPIIARYLPFVYSSALRRAGNQAEAAEITSAVFLVFARRARRLRQRAVLAAWFHQITALVSRKRLRKRSLRWCWFRRKEKNDPEDTPAWSRVAPIIDSELARLGTRHRNAFLLCIFLRCDLSAAVQILRTRERNVERRLAHGLEKLASRLRKRGIALEGPALAQILQSNAGAAAVPSGLIEDILASIDRTQGGRPALRLARRTLNTLAWRRWRRRLAIGVSAVMALLVALVIAAWHVDSRSGHSRLLAAFLVWSVKQQAKTLPALAQPARPWPTNSEAWRSNAVSVRSGADLYQTTNIWLAHLKFTRAQWAAMAPKRIGTLPNFLQPDGTALLRNPKAQRSGLAGVLGFDFEWTRADLEFSGLSFTNVGARIKGNGTYLGSLYGDKRAFKVDLNKFAKGQKLGGMDELAFNNLVVNQSFMSDALGYEFFRDAGVPAPRTAFTWMTVTVEAKWTNRPFGLYALVEPVDGRFAHERFGGRTPIFKPVTYRLFEHLGDEWPAYADIYDLKTHATAEQERRVIEFARLISFASDSELAMRLGEFLDIDEFARFMASQVLLSSYDGIFSTGQNFYVYLDPRSNKFGFIPWDLDLAWGDFFLLGTPRQQEQASIWHPWVGENRFLQRVFAADEFRRVYRAHLEDFLARLFVPAHLKHRIDELAAVLRSPIAAESEFRLDKFDQALGNKPVQPAHGDRQGADRPAHRIKRFIDRRAASVRDQLDGKSKGVVMERKAQR